jgi:signal transduction histidine kinase
VRNLTYRQIAAAIVATLSATMSAASLALARALGTTPPDFLTGNEASQWLGGLAIALTGSAIMWAGENRLGVLLAAMGLIAVSVATAQEYAVLAHAEGWILDELSAWWATFLWIPSLMGVLLTIPLLFPSGSLPSRRWRPAALVGALAVIAAVVLTGSTQQPLIESVFGWANNPLDLPIPDEPQLAAGLACIAIALSVALAGVVRILITMRRLRGTERIRAGLFACTVLLGLLGFAVGSPALSFALNALALLLMAVALIRYRLFEVEIYLPRALAYAACVGVTFATYLLVATATAPRAGAGTWAALAAAAVALAAARAIDRLRAAIARLLFGVRDRPELALADLGSRLASALGPEEVLPVAVERLCESLRLPYAVIELDGQPDAVIEHGDRPPRVASFDLNHAGEFVGVLAIGLRTGEHRLAESDRDTIAAFARQVAVAAHGVRATRDLQRSREEVVFARETERKRLHRDLHDGIGPALAGISLGLETAARLVGRDPKRASTLIAELRDDTARCVDDIRSVIADLRPTPLADLGLAESLRQHGRALEAMTDGRLTVDVDVEVRSVTPAVEVAAFRIVTEALTNVARHSGASRARVLVHARDGLSIRVSDNGCGAQPARWGTGLHSMRQRAAELGGRCTITFVPSTGTEVTATIPIPAGAS